MIAGEQLEEKWHDVMWVRTTLRIVAALLAINTVINLANSRPLLAAIDAALAPVAVLAAMLMTRRDDRGWWLTIALLSFGVVLSIAMAVANWAIGELAGTWFAGYMLWALREPPPFPWTHRASASSA